MSADYTDLINWAKTELANVNNDYLRKKSEIINELADRLAQIETIETSKICNCIKNELKGIVTARYVELVLPPEYKRNKRNNRAEKRNSYAEFCPPTEVSGEAVKLPLHAGDNRSLSYYLAHYQYTKQDKTIIRLDKEHWRQAREIIALDRKIKAAINETKRLKAEIAAEGAAGHE